MRVIVPCTCVVYGFLPSPGEDEDRDGKQQRVDDHKSVKHSDREGPGAYGVLCLHVSKIHRFNTPGGRADITFHRGERQRLRPCGTRPVHTYASLRVKDKVQASVLSTPCVVHHDVICTRFLAEYLTGERMKRDDTGMALAGEL